MYIPTILLVLLQSILSISGFFESEFGLIPFQYCIGIGRPSFDGFVTKYSDPVRYNELNYQWNLRIPHIYPLAYFIPENTKDVQIAVRCARPLNIRVIPKSGGHCYESYGFGSSGTVIIDFINMNSISVDQSRQVATIEPGALIGQVNAELWNSGQFGLPMGSCLKVGIGGLTLGGGSGWFSHYFGLTLDSLLELEMVDANGVVRIVNEYNNPDLFWALRGVGSGYIGIVTSFKFKLFNAANIHIRQVTLQYELNFSPQVLQSWQNWIKWADTNAPSVLSQVFFSGPITTQFSHVGPNVLASIIEIREDTAWTNSSLNEFIATYPPTQNYTVKYFDSYIDYVLDTGYAPVVSNKTVRELDLMNLRSEKTVPVYVKQKTFFVSNSSFAETDLNKVAEIIQQIPDRYVFVWFVTGGGAIKSVPPTATAYVHRNPPYSAMIRYEGEATPVVKDAGVKYVEDLAQVSSFMDNGQTYQNYVDGDLTDYQERYYGENLRRLILTKIKWDPFNYFKNPQSLHVSNVPNLFK